MLRLLEAQHQKIARIIQSRDTTQEGESSPADSIASPESASKRDATSSPTASGKIATSSKAKSPTTSMAAAAAKLGSHARDSSPSLAREIASRRGIPPPSRNASSPVQGRVPQQTSPDSHRRARSGFSQPKIPASVMDSQANIHAMKKSKRLESEEGFAKFYSDITTGTMSKLSSVLAYAGLPLTTEEPPMDHAAELKANKKRVTASNEPDVKKLFSKAALDAVEADHRRRGTLGHGFGPAESFYVVPNTGGTMSYAEMAKLQQHQKLSNIEEDDDDFVDAREMPGPPSPRHSRRPSAQTKNLRNSFGKPRTEEELELENTTLKHTLEQLAARLANFEAHAQDASMAALTQSMVGLRPPGNPSAPDPATEERLRQLEQQLEATAEEDEKLRVLAANQERTLKKWEKRFEALKTSAREKDKARRESKAMKGSDEAAVAEEVES